MNKKIFLFCICIFLCFNNLFSAEEDFAEIKVDASKILGKVPELFAPSIWVIHPYNRYPIDKFFKENNPKRVQLTLYWLLQPTKSFDEFKEKLQSFFGPSGEANSFIQWIKKSGAELIIGFDPEGIPNWLSSRPGDVHPFKKGFATTMEQESPPKDYKLWADVVKYSLNYFKNVLGIKKLGFYVGHEQERDWAGDEESLFKYYEFASRAAKQVDGDIKVGGIGSAHWIRYPCNSSYYSDLALSLCIKEKWEGENKKAVIEKFIRYVDKNKVPLDFINWHSFGKIPPTKFIDDAARIKIWLKEAGLERVALYPSDWSYWSGVYPADYLDTSESAAYIPQALYYMWKADINWHGHDFDVEGGGLETKIINERQESTFIGDWSLFTRHGAIDGGIIKPMYNTFSLLSIVTGREDKEPPNLLEVDFDPKDTFVPIATLEEEQDKVYLLLSNFVPEEGERFKKYILGKAETQISFLEEENKLIRKCMEENKGNGKRKMDAFLQCKNKLISTLKDPKKIEAIDFISRAYRSLNNKKDLYYVLNATKNLKYPETQVIASKLRAILNSTDARQPKEVQIQITNIPFNGKVSLTTYTIDSIHSNACSFNKKTEPTKTSAPCGIGGAIDKAVWEAKKNAKKEGAKVAEDYLLSLGYTRNAVEFLKYYSEKCRKGAIRECIDGLIMKNSNRLAYPPEKIKIDLKEAFKKYKETYHTFYYNSIDTINRWKEVSLEGSEKTDVVNIIDNRYNLNLTMEPNAIWLVILNKAD